MVNNHELLGWVSAIIAALAYGSFGVPIRQSRDLPVHPIVWQSYKTLGLFSVSSVLLPLIGPGWTPWGIVSGGLWVCGGTAGVIAIQTAGLTVAVGVWSTIMVLINFIVGIGLLHEPVANVPATTAAFSLLAIGLVGMTKYSAKKEAATEEQDEEVMALTKKAPTKHRPKKTGVYFAVVNGIFTGSSLIPLHFAKKQGYGGPKYLFSYASGALIVNTIIWLLFIIICYTRHCSCKEAMVALPPWYWSQLWWPGLVSGSLLTIGMLGAMTSVTLLGQAVGNSIVQTKILVGGLWGIGRFGEIRGKAAVKWFGCACLAITGILWLGTERLAAKRN